MAKAVAHPARVAILQLLLQHKNCFCGEVVDELPLSQPAISRHLGELVKAGLISHKPLGTKVCYSINADKIKAFCLGFQKAMGKKA